MSQMKIILASASPRRAEILSNAGIPFDVMTTQIDELRRADETVADMVLRLARAKLGAAMAQLGTKSKTRQEIIQETPQEKIIVIAADTAALVPNFSASRRLILLFISFLVGLPRNNITVRHAL